MENFQTELMEALSGEHNSNNSFYGKDEDWNNVVAHLIPHSKSSLSPDESGNNMHESQLRFHKKQKTSQGNIATSTGRLCGIQDFSLPRVSYFLSDIVQEVSLDKSNKQTENKEQLNETEISVSTLQEAEYFPNIIDLSMEGDEYCEKSCIDFDAYIALEEVDEELQQNNLIWLLNSIKLMLLLIITRIRWKSLITRIIRWTKVVGLDPFVSELFDPIESQDYIVEYGYPDN
mmetsp:Transcript_27567/g.41702  ORF Transcript_27567/g.41702 Transcript_27567/m.41702 type:complete len:232 (-) Transcript_27567:189-884(-)|eukprot:CAMPEP_0178894462 /NCGR_PEP_ID=MMETSP0786-20121207/23_1 /TAXON_ID=186022 /ORGANISM="Thalassionema frauenfeldii, Strain CCMP 1798" /LENGTH=231 /DNA_ID=CAMNT_0020564541 /DNA_START=817 /DNA_END=1512 /DNA_ORIENTATION=-